MLSFLVEMPDHHNWAASNPQGRRTGRDLCLGFKGGKTALSLANISWRKWELLSQSGEITSNFPHHSSKTCMWSWPCTLNSVNDMNEPHRIQIKPFMGQAWKARRSSWGWNNEISPLRKPGPGAAERAMAGSRGAEQSPLTNGSLPTLGLSVSMKRPLPHSCWCTTVKATGVRTGLMAFHVLVHLIPVEHPSTSGKKMLGTERSPLRQTGPPAAGWSMLKSGSG